MKEFSYESTAVDSKEKFMVFIGSEKTAEALVVVATQNAGLRRDIEIILAELYEKQFPDQKILQTLLTDTQEDILSLLSTGTTHLGLYLGTYNIADRSIIPTLMGYAIEQLPNDQLTTSIEQKLIRVLRTAYSPQFNANPQFTLQSLESRIAQSNTPRIYHALHRHYKDTLDLAMELV